MDKVHQILPANEDDLFDVAIGMVSSGTPLREGLDMIVAAQNGALICIGDVEGVLAIGNGGFKLDIGFTPQRLFELSKMDGAIVLTGDLKHIVCANFHLSPDPHLVTQETGMRHRSASRTSAQTDATVIAISKRRTQTTLYRKGEGLTLDDDSILLSKGNQGILALQAAKSRLERLAMRMSLMELDNLVTVADVAELLTHYIYVITLAAETERFISYLGNNSGLLSNQLEEIMDGVAEAFQLTIRDYAKVSTPREAKRLAASLLLLNRSEQDTEHVMHILGYEDPIVGENHLAPRGFRVISRLSMVDEAVAQRIIDEYGTLNAIVTDAKDGFDRLESLELDNVRAIAKSFMQLRSML
jgi:diadenylate cyclase